MSYSTNMSFSRREKASKFNHQYVINDTKVKSFLSQCYIPDAENLSSVDFKDYSIDFDKINDKVDCNIEKVVVVDGGYQIVNVKENYPSAEIAYYSVGLLSFDRHLLNILDKQETVDPEDIGKLKNLHKFHFVLPIKTIKFKNMTFTETVRKTIYDIFNENHVFEDNIDSSLLNTVKWLVFQEYKSGSEKGIGHFTVSCPSCNNRVQFLKICDDYLDPTNNYQQCKCGEIVYITDIFELHDLVDDFNGAGGIVSYLMSVFEVCLILSLYRFAHENKRADILTKYLFIRDGSLALYSKLDDFSYKVVRPFIQALHQASIKANKSFVNLVGLEKSGMFIEHLTNMENKLPDKTLLIPDHKYIQKYITGETNSVFGEKTYFGVKMIYKHNASLSFIVDFPLPCKSKKDTSTGCITYSHYILNPDAEDFINLKTVINILCDLRCDLYNKSFIPVTLINKLVSLSDIPSNKMLKLFTQEALSL